MRLQIVAQVKRARKAKDQEVRVLVRITAGPDAILHDIDRAQQRIAITLFTEDLLLDVDAWHTCGFNTVHQGPDVSRAAPAAVGICDDENLRPHCDTAGPIQQIHKLHETNIGQAEALAPVTKLPV